jgi:metal-responsive CopG/Arc/MetJ family transcriptional regulator
MDSLKMSKKKFTTTLDQVLIKEVKKLAIDLGLSANELIEEGMQLVLKKYRKKTSRKKNLKAM